MNEHLAAGYDVLVWKDDDGDIVCCAYTELGTRWLRAFIPSYEVGDIAQILAPPEEFARLVPDNVLVGRYTTDTKRVLPLVGPLLQ